MAADDAERARSRSPAAEHDDPAVTEVTGWVVMCPLGHVCGKGNKRLGWYDSREAANERLVDHLMDGNCDH